MTSPGSETKVKVTDVTCCNTYSMNCILQSVIQTDHQTREFLQIVGCRLPYDNWYALNLPVAVARQLFFLSYIFINVVVICAGQQYLLVAVWLL